MVQWKEHCPVLSRRNPTCGPAARVDVPQVSGGVDADDLLK